MDATGQNMCEYNQNRVPYKWQVFYAAMNQDDWNAMGGKGGICGKCIAVRGVQGETAHGFEIQTVYAKIVDQCPSWACDRGNVDFSTTALQAITGFAWDKKKITWEYVDCPETPQVYNEHDYKVAMAKQYADAASAQKKAAAAKVAAAAKAVATAQAKAAAARKAQAAAEAAAAITAKAAADANKAVDAAEAEVDVIDGAVGGVGDEGAATHQQAAKAAAMAAAEAKRSADALVAAKAKVAAAARAKVVAAQAAQRAVAARAVSGNAKGRTGRRLAMN